MSDPITPTLHYPAPPSDMTKPLQALWWLKKGGLKVGPEWDRAHTIVQAMEGVKAFDHVHALMHWIEADFGNSDYWYRHAGERRAKPNVAQEWEHIVATLTEKAP